MAPWEGTLTQYQCRLRHGHGPHGMAAVNTVRLKSYRKDTLDLQPRWNLDHALLELQLVGQDKILQLFIYIYWNGIEKQQGARWPAVRIQRFYQNEN